MWHPWKTAHSKALVTELWASGLEILKVSVNVQKKIYDVNGKDEE